MNRPSFSDLEYEVKKKKIRKEKFLQEMDDILPWKALPGVIRRHYPKGSNGRPPIGLEARYFLKGLDVEGFPASVRRVNGF